jgi:rod shape-determining protein MreB
VDRHPGLVPEPLVDPAQQGTAAGERDAPVHDVAGELRGGSVQGRLDRVDDRADRALLQPEQRLGLGERTAEAIKLAIAAVYPMQEELVAEIPGRVLVSGLPKTLQITDGEIRAAIEEPVGAIIDSIKATLDRTPPELAGDIMHKGITLTGGGALLRGIDKRLRHETGMPVYIADSPLSSVAIGSGKCLEEFEILQRVLVSPSRR